MSLWVFIDFLIFLYVGNFHNKILRKNQVTIIEVVEIICCLFNRNFKCKKDQVTKVYKFMCVCMCASVDVMPEGLILQSFFFFFFSTKVQKDQALWRNRKDLEPSDMRLSSQVASSLLTFLSHTVLPPSVSRSSAIFLPCLAKFKPHAPPQQKDR